MICDGLLRNIGVFPFVLPLAEMSMGVCAYRKDAVFPVELWRHGDFSPVCELGTVLDSTATPLASTLLAVAAVRKAQQPNSALDDIIRMPPYCMPACVQLSMLELLEEIVGEADTTPSVNAVVSDSVADPDVSRALHKGFAAAMLRLPVDCVVCLELSGGIVHYHIREVAEGVALESAFREAADMLTASFAMYARIYTGSKFPHAEDLFNGARLSLPRSTGEVSIGYINSSDIAAMIGVLDAEKEAFDKTKQETWVTANNTLMHILRQGKEPDLPFGRVWRQIGETAGEHRR